MECTIEGNPVGAHAIENVDALVPERRAHKLGEHVAHNDQDSHALQPLGRLMVALWQSALVAFSGIV